MKRVRLTAVWFCWGIICLIPLACANNPGPAAPNQQAMPTATPILTPCDSCTSTPTSTPTNLGGFTSTPTFSPTPTLTYTPCAYPGSEGRGFHDSGWAAYQIVAAQAITLVQTVTAYQAQVYLQGSNSDFRVGIYSSNSGEPGSLLSESSHQSYPGAGGWVVVDIPDVALESGEYFLAYRSDVWPNGGIAVDSTGDQSVFYTSRDFPDPWAPTPAAIWFNQPMQIKVDFCASGPPPTPSFTNSPVFSYTPTWTTTLTPSPTATPTPSLTYTPTRSPTPSPTFTLTPLCATPSYYGKTTVGGNIASTTGYIDAARYYFSAPGTITSLSVYLTASAGSVRMALYYDDYNGTPPYPKNLIGQTLSQPAVTGWNTLSLTSPITINPAAVGVFQATYYYWLAVQIQQTGIAQLPIAYDSGLANSEAYATYSYGSFPSNFPASPTFGTLDWSVYASYCP